MRIGLGSYACAWHIGVKGWPAPLKPFGVPELIDEATSLGLDLIQIADNLPLASCGPEELAMIARLASHSKVEIELGTRGIAPDHLTRYLEIASALRSRLMRVVVDTPDSQPSADEVVKGLRPLIPHFAKAQVVVAIENHDRFRSRVLADIIQRTGSPFVGICLDTANSLGANEGITEVLDNLASLTVNLHLKDIRIARKPHMMGFDISGAPVCEGALDIPGIMRRLQSNGHNPNAILELWPPFSETIEKTIEIERDWIRRSIQNLRALT